MAAQHSHHKESPITCQRSSRSFDLLVLALTIIANRCAKRNIQSVMSIACTMMLHAAIHWLKIADSTLWLMAMDHVVYLINHMPNLSTGVAPIDIFAQT
jgi:hypothetical protein